jgi:2'-5' RNA ligase
MGVYVSTKFTLETDDKLYEFIKANNIPLNHAKKHYHCTLVYSKSDFPYIHSILLNNTRARAAGWDVFGVGDNSVLVLRIESKELHERNKELMELGATSDFPDYKPHITVACADPNFDHTSLPLPKFDFVISHEYSTDIKMGETWDARKLIEDRSFLNFKDVLMLEKRTVRPREERS